MKRRLKKHINVRNSKSGYGTSGCADSMGSPVAAAKSKGWSMKMFDILFRAFGPQRWWPGDSPFEVMIGAVLTQNTNWRNVEKAIDNLKKEGVLSPHSLNEMRDERLASLIRPAGYYNVKTRRLKAFTRYFMDRSGGVISRMKKVDTDILRSELLQVVGIGPETADSILLYALEKPVFVIDAYTRRVLSRHGILEDAGSYDACQAVFHDSLPRDASLYNEYHALFVRVGKEFCKPRAHCHGCPLAGFSVDWKSERTS